MPLEEAEDTFLHYLQVCAHQAESASRRVSCVGCHTSKSIYCAECYRILVPRELWPTAIDRGTVQLPFHLDIIIDDRKTSSTGVQVASVLGACQENRGDGNNNSNSNNNNIRNFRVFDWSLGDALPDYASEQGTVLLFPSKDSQPISRVAKETRLRRVVVLDCKWAHSSVRLHPSLQGLPRVHLDTGPEQSYFWRWHNAGKGMLSTVEAVYFCAWEVAMANGWSQDQCYDMVHILWLFALQREVIRQKYELYAGVTLPLYLPFTEQGKEHQRAMRRRPHQRTVKKFHNAKSSNHG